MNRVDEDDAEPQNAPATRPSKSARKRERGDIAALAERLLALSGDELAALSLTEAVQSALSTARGLKRGARQRQLRYLTGLLSRCDYAQIAERLASLQRPQRLAVRAFHEVERWRDRLIDGDERVLDELAERFPGFDSTHVSGLAGVAAHARRSGRSPTAARQLFTYLMALREAAAEQLSAPE